MIQLNVAARRISFITLRAQLMRTVNSVEMKMLYMDGREPTAIEQNPTILTRFLRPFGNRFFAFTFSSISFYDFIFNFADPSNFKRTVVK